MLRIRQIEVPIDSEQEKMIRKKCSKILRVREDEIVGLKINKKSLDARKKPFLYYVYEVDVSVVREEKILSKTRNRDVFQMPEEVYHFPNQGEERLNFRPVIVGAGPAGLFCGYMLATYGYQPLILERGEKVEDRIKTVEEFWQSGKLDFSSNVQFGEGGAGTFSDGKLTTLVKDPFYRQKKVLEIFVECGAPQEILYESKPHIGTDLLRNIIINMRNKIISMGGEFRYHSLLTDLVIRDNQIKQIKINNQEMIDVDVLVLALGHSARDTFEMLSKTEIVMRAKPFAVGVRIEHPQSMINENQYGMENSKILPPASYKLTYHTKDNRGVYTFCMCPGGFVVNSSSEVGYLAINGMSNYRRDTENANSAIIVTISPKDFGENPLDGLNFQRNLEKKAYLLGKGKIPIQTYGDFKCDQKSISFGDVRPIMKGNYIFSNLWEIFPNYITKSLIEAIEYFDTKIKGFGRSDAILSAVESRTSSPIKIERNNLGVSAILGVYPTGEGAGYAGGITSSAMDGIFQAENIAKKYQNFDFVEETNVEKIER